MCFCDDYDYDWTAEVCNACEAHGGQDTRCSECRRMIHPEQWRYSIFQHEHEECVLCEDEEEHWVHEECDYGQTYHYERCDVCHMLLLAIRSVERRRGCPIDAQQPPLGDLQDVLYQHDDAEDYAKRAVEMWPELRRNKWVQKALSKGHK